jgi:flagellar L-ring protein precursor FlgH
VSRLFTPTPCGSASALHRIAKSTLTCGLVLLCMGCESLPKAVKVDFAEPKVATPPVMQPVKVVTGSLFNRSSYRPAFEDAKARMVGDAITIQIIETVTASQVSSSSANRTASTDASISAFPIVSAMDLAKLKVGTASTNDFSGKGGTESANTFTGSITATVVDVLPNGHLVVAGDKQIGVNQNVDVLRFSGTIDPLLIQPGNRINSTQVANARIESKGRGAQAEAQTVGWLSRFFFSVLPF